MLKIFIDGMEILEILIQSVHIGYTRLFMAAALFTILKNWKHPNVLQQWNG